jgi:hypothetical protein
MSESKINELDFAEKGALLTGKLYSILVRVVIFDLDWL